MTSRSSSSNRRRGISERLKDAYVLLPALFGMFTAGGLLGVALGINPYIPALLVMGLWTMGGIVLAALEERR